MKYAIISDIHANPAAFRTVLADAKTQKVDRIVCLGDITGYGYDAVESYMLAKENCDEWILGNHDAACAGVEADALVRGNPHYDFDIAERKDLGRDRLAEIRDLPYIFSNRYFTCAHGDFVAPRMFGYILDPEDALRSFRACDRQLMFIGHTHEAKVWALNPEGDLETSGIGRFTLVDGYRYIVNVGSVGYPRHDLFTSYAIFDGRTGEVELRRLDFDFPGYIGEFGKMGLELPVWLDRLNKMSEELLRKMANKRKLRLRMYDILKSGVR